jgi:hypothetical protein
MGRALGLVEFSEPLNLLFASETGYITRLKFSIVPHSHCTSRVNLKSLNIGFLNQLKFRYVYSCMIGVGVWRFLAETAWKNGT